MLTKKISQTLSLRLSLMVVCVIALLLLVSMAAMYFFSRQALREEALCNAQETLESTVQDVDNILLSVEQSTGNIYWDLLGHLNEPENMNVEVESESLDVVLRGTEEHLDQLSAESIRAVADLSDYKDSVGSFMPQVKIYVDGFVDVGAVGEGREYTINVVLSHA